MRVLGLDVGSRTVDAVWLEDGAVVESAVLDSGHEPQVIAAGLVERMPADRIVATGYGRHGAVQRFGAEVITEIGAYALGAAELFPEARSILDIGGQDTKVIVLGPGGKVEDFEMNDKCAAGTGRFLEVMARALEVELDGLGAEALAADGAATVTSMCTVFAESEVIGLLHRGEPRASIARGLHEAVARRTLSALRRVGAAPPLVFAGGGARNPALVELIGAGVGGELLLTPDPQTVGALGAALYGWRSSCQRQVQKKEN
jgi:(R)-2-hydroxyacyl-CoA dehydratese activating ATPase